MSGHDFDLRGWNILHRDGHDALRARRFDEAEARFRRAQAEVERCRAQGKLEDAERLLRRELAQHEQRHGHLVYAELIVPPLAHVLLAEGKGTEAADLYRRFVRDLGRRPTRPPPDQPAPIRRALGWSSRVWRDEWLARALDGYARLLSELGRPAAARRATARASRLRERVDAERRAYAQAEPSQEVLWVDFNTMSKDFHGAGRRVRIHPSEVRPWFREGLRVVIFDLDLQVAAELEFDHERQQWWARPDWATRRDLLP